MNGGLNFDTPYIHTFQTLPLTKPVEGVGERDRENRFIHSEDSRLLEDTCAASNFFLLKFAIFRGPATYMVLYMPIPMYPAQYPESKGSKSGRNAAIFRGIFCIAGKRMKSSHFSLC